MLTEANISDMSQALRLAIITASFTPEDYDFDAAMLAIGLAVDARPRFLSVDILAVASHSDLSRFLPVTAGFLADRDIGMVTISSELDGQSRAVSVANYLNNMSYDVILSLDPALIAFAVRAKAGADDRQDAFFASIVCRTEISSKSSQGWFLDGPESFSADRLVIHGIHVSDIAFFATSIAQDLCTRLGIDNILRFEPAGHIGQLSLEVFGGARAGSKGPPRRVVLGNLDYRNGLEVIATAFADAKKLAIPVVFLGHCGETPVGHGLSQIAEAAVKFNGSWDFITSIDTLQLLRSLRAGDALISCSDGGLCSAGAIATSLGIGIMQRDLAESHLSFGRRLRALMGTEADLSVPGQSTPPCDSIFASIASAIEKRRRLSVAMIKPPSIAIVYADEFGSSRSCIDQRVQALDTAIRGTTDEFVLVLARGSHSPSLLLISSWVLRLGGDLLLWPAMGSDGVVSVPAISPAEILADTSIGVPVFCVSVAHYRMHCRDLRARTLPGFVREVTLRFSIGGVSVQSVPTPIFSDPDGGLLDRAYTGRLLYDDAISLADLAASYVRPELADAIYLYQGLALNRKPAYVPRARIGFQFSKPQFAAGEQELFSQTRNPIDRWLERIGHGEFGEFQTDRVGFRRVPINEEVVHWVVAKSLSNRTESLADTIRSYVADFPVGRRVAVRSLAFLSLQSVGRSETAELL